MKNIEFSASIVGNQMNLCFKLINNDMNKNVY